MKMTCTLLLFWMVATLPAAEDEGPKELFPDKNLERAVRKFVFEKRDNDKRGQPRHSEPGWAGEV
jgi:hypothetical protein